MEETPSLSNVSHPDARAVNGGPRQDGVAVLDVHVDRLSRGDLSARSDSGRVGEGDGPEVVQRAPMLALRMAGIFDDPLRVALAERPVRVDLDGNCIAGARVLDARAARGLVVRRHGEREHVARVNGEVGEILVMGLPFVPGWQKTGSAVGTECEVLGS